jgi:cytoskeletal protein CcmA (bactofilin family)
MATASTGHASRSGERSTIARGTVVRGSVRGDGDLDIHGRVEGSVELGGELLISEGALIKSDVSARRVVVRGAVAGNVSGHEAVVLEPGARVVGDLHAPSIGIRPGALVRGNVSTFEGAAPPVRAAARHQAPARAPSRAKVMEAPPAPSRAAGRAASRGNAGSRDGAAAPAPKAPPPPVVPVLRKGTKAQLRRKGAR